MSAPTKKRRTEPFVNSWVGAWLRSIRINTPGAPKFAEIAKELGMSEGSLSMFERGLMRVPIDRLPQVMRAYRVSPGRMIDELVARGTGPTGTGTGGVVHATTVDQSS